jgi:hypothetical protein
MHAARFPAADLIRSGPQGSLSRKTRQNKKLERRSESERRLQRDNFARVAPEAPRKRQQTPGINQESTKIRPPKINEWETEPIPIPVCSRLDNYDTR